MSLEAPFEVSGVKEIKDSTSATPFIVVRMRNETDGREKFLLKAGDGVSWERYCRSVCAGDVSLAAEGRIKHFPVDKKIIIYSSPGPSHKLTFSILKSNFPDYNSIMWRDG